jgi:hypothetical protein
MAPAPRALVAEVYARLAPQYRFVSPLVQAAELDTIDLVGLADPAAPFPRSLKHTKRATVALVGDDPGRRLGLGGPDAWRCAERLRRWCRGVIVHAAGGEAEHYAAAVAGALTVGRLALIETTTHHAVAWAERLACPQTLMIIPSTGPHPLPGAEVVH